MINKKKKKKERKNLNARWGNELRSALAATFVIKSRLHRLSPVATKTRRNAGEEALSRRFGKRDRDATKKSVWNGAEKDGRPPPDRNKITENSRESWSRTFEKGLEIPLRAIEFVSRARNLYGRITKRYRIEGLRKNFMLKIRLLQSAIS